MKPEYKALLEKQQYGLVGSHGAVKICTWTRKSLRDEGVCYKQDFYGIKSHLCCQITPSLGLCTNQCLFCWRDLDYKFDPSQEWSDPEEIIEGCLKKHKLLLSGFGGNDKANMDKFEQAKEPLHFAISLSGEPTMYPKLNELIRLLHEKGKTTFVVTNGMLPDRLKEIEPPTQLYLSVDAPNKELFDKVDKPLAEKSWENLNESLNIMNNLKDKTRTALRLTLIKGINMVHPEQWASLIDKAEPLFVEVKAYMFVGSSRERLEMENMPRHNEIVDFTKEICKHNDYKIVDEKQESRVVLLMKGDQEKRFIDFK